MGHHAVIGAYGEQNRENDHAVTMAWCARGRIDASQLMQIIDQDREAVLRAEWERVVSGKGFMSDDGE